MKSRILPKERLRAGIGRMSDVDAYLKEEGPALMRRCLKVTCIALNQEFGFGRSRLLTYMDKVGEISTGLKHDPVAWDNIDKALGQIGVLEAVGTENYEDMEHRMTDKRG